MPDFSALALFPYVLLLAILAGLPRAMRGTQIREAIASDAAAAASDAMASLICVPRMARGRPARMASSRT